MMNLDSLTLEHINDSTRKLEKGVGDNGTMKCCICLVSYSKVIVERSGKNPKEAIEKNKELSSEFREDCGFDASTKSSSLHSTEDYIPSSSSSSSSPSLCSSYDEEEGELNRRFFALHSCGHMMCTSCLASYCASKVMDGNVIIKCCHIISEEKHKSNLDEFSPQRQSESQLICKKIITKDDIIFLLNRFDAENSTSQAQWISVPGNNLLEKYERFRFDQMHCETSRRCPDCGHPHIFDMVDAMQDQKKAVPSIDNKTNGYTIEKKQNGSKSKQENKLWTRRKVKKKETKQSLENYEGDEKHHPKSIEKVTIPIPPEDMFCIPVTEADQSNLEIDLQNRGSFAVRSKSYEKAKMAYSTDVQQNNKFELANPVENKNHYEPGNNFDQALEAQDKDENIIHSGIEKHKKIPKQPIVNCQKCYSVFCYYHSNAHRGKTCEQYEVEIRDCEEKTKVYLEKAGSKQCPNCGAVVVKDGGCNHMKCGSCETCFCWLCLTIVEDTAFPSHFQWWNISGCPNMQMREGEEPTYRAIMWSRFLSLCQMVIIGPPSFILSTMTMIFCYCCFVASGNSSRERFSNLMSFWGNLITGLLLLGFIFSVGIALAMAFMAVAIVISFFCLNYGVASSNASNDTGESSTTNDAMIENDTADNDTTNVSKLDLTSQEPKLPKNQLQGKFEKTLPA